MHPVLYCWMLYVWSGFNSQSCIKLERDDTVTWQGLYFPDDRFSFGPRISPSGSSSIQVYKNYIFVVYYRGGMDDRRVSVARKRVGDTTTTTGSWVRIELPHRHIFDRGDKDLPENERRGDSHNYIAIGISPKDETIHLLYDMHAQTKEDFPTDYFNYQVSEAGAATVPDEDFTLQRFHPEQLRMNEQVKESEYYKATYPVFSLTSSGDLLAQWRRGGTHDAIRVFNRYDGTKWTPPWLWNENSGDKLVGFYGSFLEFKGKMFAAWSRRSEADKRNNIQQNAGLYFGYSDDMLGNGDWFTLSGQRVGFPITDFEPFLVDEPAKPGDRMSGPDFVVTKQGSVLMSISINGTTSHLFRKQSYDNKNSSAEFELIPNAPSGDFHLYGDSIYTVALEDGQPVVWKTKQDYIRWEKAFVVHREPYFSHGVSIRKGKRIYYYGMQKKPQNQDARPLHVLRFILPPKSAVPRGVASKTNLREHPNN